MTARGAVAVEAPQTWAERADVAQRSLDLLWGAPWPQLLHNAHPVRDESTFNYWWLAHVVDVRLDGFARSGDVAYLEAARSTARNIRERNGDSVVNDYFDDMLWYALALLRLVEAEEAAGGDGQEWLEQVQQLWQHVLEHGWTSVHGESMSWRRQQPDYKNTPANGPFIILGARLARRSDAAEPLARARTAMAWLQTNLVRDDGFVWDGLGREGGAAVDTHWRFTYNQGLYIGACVEMFRSDGDTAWLTEAERTALVAISELAPDGVFLRDGADLDDRVPDVDGGDTGLFKGIWYRYAALLLQDRDVPAVREVIRTSTEALWRHDLLSVDEIALADGAPWAVSGEPVLRAGDDWRRPAPTEVGYSTQLSAIMATEVRAALER